MLAARLRVGLECLNSEDSVPPHGGESSPRKPRESKTLSTLRRMMDNKPLPLILSPLAKFATSRLKLAEKRVSTIEDCVELVFYWHFFPLHLSDFFTIEPAQIKWEITQLLAFVCGLQAKTVLEIGTARGGTLYLFTNVVDRDAVIITVDLPSGPFGGGYPRWKIPFYKSFAKGRQKIELIRENSHDSAALEQVKSILNGKEIDFLFIDGDHRYEGVRKDFEMYGTLVRKGGLIAFHDIVPHPPESECKVSKFWSNIMYSHRHTEIVKNWKQKWGGIGVLFIE